MIKLIFEEDEHTSQLDIKMALYAADYASALWHIREEVLRILNHDHPIDYETVDKLRLFINDEIENLPRF